MNLWDLLRDRSSLQVELAVERAENERLRAVVDGYEAQITAMDVECAGLERQIATLRNHVARLEAGLDVKTRQAATALYAATVAHHANDELARQACPGAGVRCAHLAEQLELVKQQRDDFENAVIDLHRQIGADQ
jgi:uncharacterized small protein (DUF1192 family)